MNMDAGFNGDTLAVFTALSPAGAIAFACLAIFLLFKPGLENDERNRLSHFLFVPLAATWIGFVASATHLGTPANALHVVWGIGRSPLSNEVAAAMAFLFVGGVCWMHSYKQRKSAKVERALLGASALTACALVAFTSLAYAVPTVPTWDTWFTPVNLCATALVSGPALAVATLQAARVRMGRWPYVLLAVALVALVAGCCVLVAHAAWLQSVGNHVVVAASLVPQYPAVIAAHALVALAGGMLQVLGLRMSTSRARGMAFGVLGCALVLGSAVMVRFAFYASYMSVAF